MIQNCFSQVVRGLVSMQNENFGTVKHKKLFMKNCEY